MLTQVLKGRVVEDTHLCSCCGKELGSSGSFSYGIHGVPRVYCCDQTSCKENKEIKELNKQLVRCYFNVNDCITDKERDEMIEHLLREKYEAMCDQGDYGLILEELLNFRRKGCKGYNLYSDEDLIGAYADEILGDKQCT